MAFPSTLPIQMTPLRVCPHSREPERVVASGSGPSRLNVWTFFMIYNVLYALFASAERGYCI